MVPAKRISQEEADAATIRDDIRANATAAAASEWVQSMLAPDFDDRGRAFEEIFEALGEIEA